jgi:hypothetical protein
MARGVLMDEHLVGYNAMARDLDDRKSTSGMLFYLDNNPVN